MSTDSPRLKSIRVCDLTGAGVILFPNMLKQDPRILDDIAKVAGGAINVLSGLRQQIETEVKARVEEIAARMDLVPREDVDRLEAVIAKMQADQKAMMKRLDALEGKKKAPAKRAAKKTSRKTTKKSAKKK